MQDNQQASGPGADPAAVIGGKSPATSAGFCGPNVTPVASERVEAMKSLERSTAILSDTIKQDSISPEVKGVLADCLRQTVGTQVKLGKQVLDAGAPPAAAPKPSDEPTPASPQPEPTPAATPAGTGKKK